MAYRNRSCLISVYRPLAVGTLAICCVVVTPEPRPHGPFDVRAKAGDAVLDGVAVLPAAVDDRAGRHAQLTRQVFDFDPLFGHRGEFTEFVSVWTAEASICATAL